MPRVLLIDDDEFVAVSLRQYLEARACEVVSATDRTAAEQQLAAAPFDLVLVDPYMTGEANRDTEQMLRYVRSVQPAARIVIVTAYTSPQMIAAAEATGATAVLTKPQSVVFLSQIVTSALRTQRNPSAEMLSA